MKQEWLSLELKEEKGALTIINGTDTVTKKFDIQCTSIAMLVALARAFEPTSSPVITHANGPVDVQKYLRTSSNLF
jgi:hypothetical protein